jgi:cell division transport system ATP-binding protein
MTQINYHNVEVRQQEMIVLEQVDLKIKKGEFVYLIGKVGSGKSSLLKTMYGELDVFGGSAEVLGYDLTHIRRKQIPALRKRIGIVFQDFQLLTDRNVRDNLDFVLKATGCSDKRKRQLRIEEVLELVGMQTKGYKMPHELSGGEQQRIVIARAILNTPEIILADEPTGNLDPETGRQIVELLRKIRAQGSTVIMTTHNLQLLEEFPGKVFRCENHRIVEQEINQVTEISEIPETPATHEVPVVTETPVLPENPVATEAPEVTETPVVPETPVATETPVVTETPASPANTEHQEAPEDIDVLESPDYLESLGRLLPQESKDNNQ